MAHLGHRRAGFGTLERGDDLVVAESGLLHGISSCLHSEKIPLLATFFVEIALSMRSQGHGR